MNFFLNFAISLYITSAGFMLYLYYRLARACWRDYHCLPVMNPWHFLLLHFCPIYNTYGCFKIMIKAARLMIQQENNDHP